MAKRKSISRNIENRPGRGASPNGEFKNKGYIGYANIDEGSADEFFDALTSVLGSNETDAMSSRMDTKCKQCHDVIDGPNTPDLCNSCFYLNIIGMDSSHGVGKSRYVVDY